MTWICELYGHVPVSSDAGISCARCDAVLVEWEREAVQAREVTA